MLHSTLNIPATQYQALPEVEFLISKQPDWSNWSRSDIELWVNIAYRKNLVFTTYGPTGKIRTVIVGRRVSRDVVECLMFCGDTSAIPATLLSLDEKYKTVVFTRNKRRSKINLDRLRKHYVK